MPKVIVSDADGEREFGLSKDEVSIGRVAGQNDIVLKVPEASRNHCRLLREGSAWFVEDLGSSNGTRVNGRKVTKFELQDGDEIQVGVAVMRYLESEPAPAAGAGDEIDLEPELELSLEDDAFVRFLGGPRSGEKIVLAGRATVGRRSTHTIVLEEKGVSGSHSEFVHEKGVWKVRDLGSTNGTLLNGEKISEADLSPGDVVKIGVVELSFGIGENEGSAEVRSTVIMPGTGLDDEVFAISEEHMHRKRRTSAVLTFGVLVALLGSGAYWVMQGTNGNQSKREVKAVTGNMIARGASFELDEVGEEDYLSTESDAIEFEEINRPVASGDWALQITARGGESSEYLVFSAPIANVVSSDRFRIGAAFRTASISGRVGMAVRWKDASGRPLAVSHVLAPAGASSFVEVDGLVEPPIGAVSANLAIGLHGAQGKVQVDDVRMVRLFGEAARNVEAHGFTSFLASNGVASLVRDGGSLADDIGFRLIGGEGSHGIGDRAVATAEEREAGRSRVIGEIAAVDDGPSGSFWTEVRAEGTGMVYSGEFSGEGRGLAFGMNVDSDQGVVTVAAGGAVRHFDSFKRDDVSEIIIGSGQRTTRIGLDPPASVSMQAKQGRGELLLPLGTAGETQRYSFAFQLDFETETARVNELRELASKAHRVEGRLAEAMRLYGEIVDRYSFRKDIADWAAEGLADIRKSGEAKVAELTRRVDDVIFFRTFRSDYDTILEQGKATATAYEGSEIGAALGAQLERLRVARDDSRRAENEELARRHLARGLDLMTQGRAAPSLARSFFLSVKALVGAESELAVQADQELVRIASLVGTK